MKKDWEYLSVELGYMVHCTCYYESWNFLTEVEKKLRSADLTTSSPSDREMYFSIEKVIEPIDVIESTHYEVREVYPREDSRILEWSEYVDDDNKKGYLKNGTVIETAEGRRMVKIGKCFYGEGESRKRKDKNQVFYLTNLDRYDHDLRNISPLGEDWDITKIFRVTDGFDGDFHDLFNSSSLELIWKREEESKDIPVKEVTIEELEKELGYKVKIVG